MVTTRKANVYEECKLLRRKNEEMLERIEPLVSSWSMSGNWGWSLMSMFLPHGLSDELHCLKEPQERYDLMMEYVKTGKYETRWDK